MVSTFYYSGLKCKGKSKGIVTGRSCIEDRKGGNIFCKIVAIGAKSRYNKRFMSIFTRDVDIFAIGQDAANTDSSAKLR